MRIMRSLPTIFLLLALVGCDEIFGNDELIDVRVSTELRNADLTEGKKILALRIANHTREAIFYHADTSYLQRWEDGEWHTLVPKGPSIDILRGRIPIEPGEEYVADSERQIGFAPTSPGTYRYLLSIWDEKEHDSGELLPEAARTSNVVRIE